MMKILPLSLLLFVISFQAICSEIQVPSFLIGVKPHSAALKGNYYQYKIDYKLGPIKVVAKKTKNLTVEELVQTLINSYETKNKQDFLNLFTSKAKQSIQSMPPDQFEQVWGFYTSRKNWEIHFYHAHKNGYLIGLKSEGEKNFNLQFAVKAGGVWSFEALEMDDKDTASHNIGMWMTYQPMKIQPARLIQTFKNTDSKKYIEAQMLYKYMAVMVKGKTRWELLGQIKDNEDEFSTWSDKNTALGMVKIDLEDYEQPIDGKAEILVLDSSFPIEFYPLSLESKGQFTP